MNIPQAKVTDGGRIRWGMNCARESFITNATLFFTLSTFEREWNDQQLSVGERRPLVQ